MASGSVKKLFVGTALNFGTYTNTTANTWEYTGFTITVPDGHIYIGYLDTRWVSGRPTGIGINRNSDTLLGDIPDQSNENENGVYSTTVFLTPGTWYVFAKHNNVAQSGNPYTIYYIDFVASLN